MVPPLSALGIAHIILSLMAIVCAVLSLKANGVIRLNHKLGGVFFVTTLLVALSSFGLHARTAFGPGHVLAIFTLLALLVAFLAAKSKVFGARSFAVEVGALSATLIFHAIPGVAEMLTRLPPDAPLVYPAESPIIRVVSLTLLLIGVCLIYRQLKRVTSRA